MAMKFRIPSEQREFEKKVRIVLIAVAVLLIIVMIILLWPSDKEEDASQIIEEQIVQENITQNQSVQKKPQTNPLLDATVQKKQEYKTGNIEVQVELNRNIWSLIPQIPENHIALKEESINGIKYSQELKFDILGKEDEVPRVIFEKNDEDNVSDFLVFYRNNPLYEYTLEFDKPLSISDLDKKNLKILGNDYTVTNIQDDPDKITLQLSRLEYFDVKKLTPKKIEFAKNTYDIDLISTKPAYKMANLNINGEVIAELKVGDDQILKDGTSVGLSEIYNESAKIYLSGHTIRIGDDNTKDSEYEKLLCVINSKKYSNCQSRIRADKNKIESISIKMYTSNEEVFIFPNTGLSDYEDYKGLLFNGAIDIRYLGLKNEEYTKFSFTTIDAEDYDLSIGKETFPLLDASNDDENIFKYGESVSDFWFFEADEKEDYMIKENDYILLSKNENNKILKYDSANKNNWEITFKDLDGNKITALYDVDDDKGELKLGKNVYRFYLNSKLEMSMDQNADGKVNGKKITYDVGDLKVSFGDENKIDDEIQVEFENEDYSFQVDFYVEDGKIIFDLPKEDEYLRSLDDEDDSKKTINNYGVQIREYTKNKAKQLDILYPKNEVKANLLLEIK